MLTALRRLWTAPPTGPADYACALARGMVGLREGHAEIDALIRWAGGTDSRSAWCAYAAEGWLRIGGRMAGLSLLTPTSGGVVRWWHATDPADRIEIDALRAGSARARPGDVYHRTRRPEHAPAVLAGASALGHCGLVVAVRGNALVTVDGNTNGAGSADGDGVYLREVPLSDPRLIGVTRPRWG